MKDQWRRHDKDLTRRVFIKLNVRTDADILKFLDNLKEPKQTLVKRLIREHMKGASR